MMIVVIVFASTIVIFYSLRPDEPALEHMMRHVKTIPLVGAQALGTRQNKVATAYNKFLELSLIHI